MSKEWQSGEDGEIRFPLPFRVYDGTGKGKRRPLVLYFSGNAFGAAPPRLGDAPAAAAMAEAGALVVQPAGCAVRVAARELRVEEVQAFATGHRRTCSDWGGGVGVPRRSGAGGFRVRRWAARGVRVSRRSCTGGPGSRWRKRMRSLWSRRRLR